MPGPHALLRDARDYIMGKDAGPENTTVFPHSDTSPFWMSGQINFIFQWHPSFYAAYSGTNSFRHASEQALSRYLTLYTGAVLTPTTEGIFDLESAGGSGLSDALGIAGYPNLDVVRNPELSAAPYMARVWLRQVIPLSNEIETVPRTPLSMLTQLPVRRLDIHIGDMSLPDFFDINPVGSDSHMQFMNWAIDNDPAWDYAADTRGYTWAIVIEYWDRNFALRFADALEPTTANGINLQWDLQKAHSENYEIEYHPSLLEGRDTAIRTMAYMNTANMGVYTQAINQYFEHLTPVPEITDHGLQKRVKYGFGLNLYQELTQQLRAFARVGWNEGQHESWAYTETDQVAEIGADLTGEYWDRPNDKWGVAYAIEGLSNQHREYLAHGGLGFILGDGNLSYGREKVLETYYTFPLSPWPGFYLAFDFQYIDNPGYNRVRGPVYIPGARLHIEL
jgi:high affinity Mn2+ porin